MYFYDELRGWITMVINQRTRLIKIGASNKNPKLMTENINHLSKYLNYYSYESNLQISKFFQTNRSRILTLLPGEGAGGHQKRQEQFVRYDQFTRQLLDNCPISVDDSRVCAFRRPGVRTLPLFSSFPE